MNDEKPTRAQLNRFYAWIGLFAGAIVFGMLSAAAKYLIPDLPWMFYLWMDRMQTSCFVTAGILLTLAAWRAAAIITCEDHLLLKLADRVRERRERLEGGVERMDDK